MTAGGAELVVLGAGSILPRPGYGCAGYALCPEPGGEVTLFDCGPGSVRALGPAGIELTRVRRVVLSHFHPDHCLDVLALLFARRNPALREVPPLELIGPVGLRRILAGGAAAFGRWVEDPRASVCEVELDARGRAHLVRGEVRGELELDCAATGHSPEALAWRVTSPGWSFAYSGDTPENPDVAELAREVGLFVVECSFPDEQAVPSHLSPQSAGRMAELARCRRLVLTHFYPEMDPDLAVMGARGFYGGPIAAARDGARFELA